MIQVISFQKLEFFKSSKGPELPNGFELSGWGGPSVDMGNFKGRVRVRKEQFVP